MLPVEESVRRCEECHSKGAPELSALYGEDASDMGHAGDAGPALNNGGSQAMSNADTLSDVYVIGANRSSGLDRLSMLVVLLFFLALVGHALARVLFRKTPRKTPRRRTT